MLGKVIGNYQITSELAQGGMGAVFRGRHVSLPREVVVKSILLSSFPAHAQDQLKARFLREAYVQSQLSHPNIVGVYEFFTASENYYLVMEFVDGMSLRDLISRQGPLTPNQALPLIKQALSALDFAHNFNYVDESGNRHTGIIHRDIKPANLLLDGMARLKITDFGIVKLAGESSLTRTGFNPGTIEFMSPEQIRGLEVDSRSDLYSLGVTFYQMLTGRLPFPSLEESSEYEVLKSHVEMSPQAISEIKPDLPAELAAIVMRSLEKKPLDRFQSAAESLEALLEYETRSAVKEKSPKQQVPVPLQATHSMTELLEPNSSEPATIPIPAVMTSAPAPRPAQALKPESKHQYQTNLMANLMANPMPQSQQRQEHQRNSRNALIVAGALIALIAIIATAYFLWKQSNSSIDEANSAVTNSSPIASPSTNAPTNQAAPEALAVSQARAAEQEERYADAIKLFDDYLRENPQASSADTIKTQVAELKKLQGLLTMAEVELKQQDYTAARRDFSEALKLRPESKRVQAGLAEAETKLARSR